MLALLISLVMPLGACNAVGNRDGGAPVQRGGIMCTQEAKLCPDGSYVSRNAANHCAFDPCPAPDTKPAPQNNAPYTNELIPYGCPREVMKCPDGSSVSRIPANHCAFAACP